MCFTGAILPFAQKCLVSTVVNVQYNIYRGQKKSVRTIFIRNFEINDSILFSGGQSVLLWSNSSEKAISYTTLPSLRFSTASVWRWSPIQVLTPPAQPGLSSELVCLPSLFSTKPFYFLVAVDTCTHWVPIFSDVFLSLVIRLTFLKVMWSGF